MKYDKYTYNITILITNLSKYHVFSPDEFISLDEYFFFWRKNLGLLSLAEFYDTGEIYIYLIINYDILVYLLNILVYLLNILIVDISLIKYYRRLVVKLT